MVNVKVTKSQMQINTKRPQTEIDNSNVKLVKGDTGAVFYPHVDEFSNLSWSNDKGLDNPPTVNIRGRDGSDTVERISNMAIETIMEG